MTPLQLELTRLIGKKELSFGCLVTVQSTDLRHRYVWYDEEYEVDTEEEFYYVCKYDGILYSDRNGCETLWKMWANWNDWKIIEIIWHPATLADFHRWMNENVFYWSQWYESFSYDKNWISYDNIPYDSSKELLDQSEETLQQIISLIKTYTKETNAA